MTQFWRFETSTVHAGHEPDADSHSIATPIYPSAAFAFDSAQHSAELFDGVVDGYIYSRIANPTVRSLEARLATLEQGIGAVAFASGQAAVASAVQTIAVAGDNIVSASSLYGTTYKVFSSVFRQSGMEVRFARYDDLDQFAALIDDKTRAIYCESMANPAGHIPDLAPLAELAHRHGLPLIVDNTVATPYLCRPFEHGADIVVHSLTKYLGGHGVALGGCVVDAGQFDWKANESRFKLLSMPDPCHHNTVFTERYGRHAYIRRVQSVPLRNMGAVLSPFNAFLIMQGMETLALRMDRICFNAELIAGYLQQHPAVSWVNYPALEGHPERPRLERYMRGKASGVFSFGVQGGRAAGERFQNALRLIRRSVNIGDCKTLACHPASTTHRQVFGQDLAASGVTEDMVRLSVGIEHVEDLVDDLDQALAASIN